VVSTKEDKMKKISKYLLIAWSLLIIIKELITSRDAKSNIEVLIFFTIIATIINLIKEIKENKENKEFRKIQKLYTILLIFFLIYAIVLNAYMTIPAIIFAYLVYNSNQRALIEENPKLKKEYEKRKKIINYMENRSNGIVDNGFEEEIKKNCNIKTKSGKMVQSQGERKIADFLHDNHIEFDYDEQITLKSNEKNEYGITTNWVRPDFYLTEFNIIIEYWGLLGDENYDEKMNWKKRIYKESNQKLISITPKELKDLKIYLIKKLNRYGTQIN
jgi:hypothetical protein